MAKPLALIVDDEPDIRELITITLQQMDIDVVAAADLKSAKEALQTQTFALCLTDMRLPDGDGLALVEHMQEVCSQCPIAVLTAYGNMELAVQALKAGAFDFVSKPVNLKLLRDLVNTALRLVKTDLVAQDSHVSKQLLGESAVAKRLRATTKKLARSQAPVYICGPSGSGKELLAHLIHQQGPRAERAFVPVNCGAIPAELMESEFFGHKKGSYTGAHQDKAGLFVSANGGTLFLDEIADLPLAMQVKLLRAIQEKAVRPVGGEREISVDVRVLSATHRDLEQLVQAGEFRQDLYYRINVIKLDVPGLNQRREDIAPLAEHILQKLASDMQIAHPKLSQASLAALESYAFPGNVRELENILERALTLCEGEQISEEDLQLPDSNSQLTQSDAPLDTHLDDVEKNALVDALAKTHWNKTAAAKLLGISFRAIRYRLKKYDIE